MTRDELLEALKARRRFPPAECRRIREEAGLSLREVAAALDISFAAVGTWERGQYQPKNLEKEQQWRTLMADIQAILEETAADLELQAALDQITRT